MPSPACEPSPSFSRCCAADIVPHAALSLRPFLCVRPARPPVSTGPSPLSPLAHPRPFLPRAPTRTPRGGRHARDRGRVPRQDPRVQRQGGRLRRFRRRRRRRRGTTATSDRGGGRLAPMRRARRLGLAGRVEELGRGGSGEGGRGWARCGGGLRVEPRRTQGNGDRRGSARPGSILSPRDARVHAHSFSHPHTSGNPPIGRGQVLLEGGRDRRRGTHSRRHSHQETVDIFWVGSRRLPVSGCLCPLACPAKATGGRSTSSGSQTVDRSQERGTDRQRIHPEPVRATRSRPKSSGRGACCRGLPVSGRLAGNGRARLLPPQPARPPAQLSPPPLDPLRMRGWPCFVCPARQSGWDSTPCDCMGSLQHFARRMSGCWLLLR